MLPGEKEERKPREKVMESTRVKGVATSERLKGKPHRGTYGV